MSLSKSRGKHAQPVEDAAVDEAVDEAAEQLADPELVEEASEAPSDAGAQDGEEAADNSGDAAPDAENAPDLEQGPQAEPEPGAEPGQEPAGESEGEPVAQPGHDSDSASAPEAAEPEASASGATEPLAVPAVGPIEDSGGTGYVAAQFGEIPKKKRRRGLKAFGITLGVIAALALIVYVAGAIVFMGRFLPNTSIGENDVSLKTDAEVAEVLEGIVNDYQLNVVGNGFSYRMSGDDVGLAIDTDAVVQKMHADLNSWRWPLLVIEPEHDEAGQLLITFDRTAYESELNEAIVKYNETAKAPVNATIVYEEKVDKFVVKPEEAGTQLDSAAVLSSVGEALSNLEPKLALGQDQLVQPTVLSTDEKLIEAAELASGMVSAKLTLVMGGQDVGEVNGDAISPFITVGENFEVTFKEEELDAWVDELAGSFNTIGTERTYTRADGKAIAVSGGVYGWEVDTDALKEAVLEGVKAGSTAEIEVPCSETAEAYNGANQRDWGNRYIDVDITEQHVRFYGDNGKVIWEADCISGSPDGKHDTVKGVWTVNAKESPSKLIGYENGKKIYETKVQFWMPFEGNSIGFHDATWQPSFGGSMYANGYGSHGCVNLSYADAESLYGLIEEGDVVVVHA